MEKRKESYYFGIREKKKLIVVEKEPSGNSCYCLNYDSKYRKNIFYFVTNPNFDNTVIIVILISTMSLVF
jgi:hypothetical protein